MVKYRLVSVCILASGRGKRFKEDISKSLLKLDGKNTILDFQMKYLKKKKLTNITIVFGYWHWWQILDYCEDKYNVKFEWDDINSKSIVEIFIKNAETPNHYLS